MLTTYTHMKPMCVSYILLKRWNVDLAFYIQCVRLVRT